MPCGSLVTRPCTGVFEFAEVYGLIHSTSLTGATLDPRAVISALYAAKMPALVPAATEKLEPKTCFQIAACNPSCKSCVVAAGALLSMSQAIFPAFAMSPPCTIPLFDRSEKYVRYPQQLRHAQESVGGKPMENDRLRPDII